MIGPRRASQVAYQVKVSSFMRLTRQFGLYSCVLQPRYRSVQNYTNSAEQLELDVSASVTGGFTVSIRSTENPACAAIRDEIADARAEIADLQADLQGATPAEKAGIVRGIRAQQAKSTAHATGKISWM